MPADAPSASAPIVRASTSEDVNRQRQAEPDPTRERFSLADQIAEVERELRYRYGVYAKRVEDGKMSRAQADKQIALMRNVRDTLRMIAAHYGPVRKAVADDLQREKEAAEVAELMKNPAVQAVVAAFPDSHVGLPRRPAPEPEPYHPEPPPFGHDSADAEWASEAQSSEEAAA